MKIKLLLLLLTFFSFSKIQAQDIELYQQFNGRFDYTAIGATLNFEENNLSSNCTIDTLPTVANLTLAPTQQLTAAYLYWAGSGEGDFEVNLNQQPIIAERMFNHTLEANNSELLFFSAFADVTSIIQETGNGDYTLSDLYLFDDIQTYCSNSTNFGGWSIIVVYEDADLPLNQLSLFDGLQGVSANEGFQDLTIELNNLSVIDTEGAKIGFLAWEGDNNLNIAEELSINGNQISNPPLNPVGEAFNGTNSFTGSSEFYNMDLDFYNIENNISVGDTQATIQLHTGEEVNIGTVENPVFQLRGDLILINNVITVLNSILPDPTPEINSVATNCFSTEITVNYTVNNFNSTGAVPPNTPILFYAEGILLGQTVTQNTIPINSSEAGQINLTLPVGIEANATITMIVNEDVNGNIIVPEINNDNNETVLEFVLPIFDFETEVMDLELCDDIQNNEAEFFDLTQNTPLAIGEQENVTVSYFLTQQQADENDSPISTPSAFENTENPQEIFIRLTFIEDEDCYITDSFFLNVNFTPLAETGNDLEVCEYNAETGSAFFDLTDNEELIINNQLDTEIDYYQTIENAQNAENEILNPQNFENTSNPQLIYTRLSNEEHPECFSISTFQLKVTSLSLGEIEAELKQCDANGTQAFFDLTQNSALAIYGQDNVTLDYFLTETQAENNDAPITNPSNYQNINNPQQVFIRITSEENENCYLVDSFLLSVFDTPEIGQGENLVTCDDSTNDEVAIFNLTDNNSILINGQNTAELNFYINEEDAINLENEIANPQNFTNTSNPQTIFTRLTNPDFTDCFSISSFQIRINPIQQIALDETLLRCDIGFNMANFDLTEIEEFLPLTSTQEIEGYYTSAENASFQTNNIIDFENFENSTSPQIIFIRVEEIDACYQLYTFLIEVENCPPFIPEGYSPNGDGINDTFHISGLYNIFEKFNLKIYSRHGNLIYEGNNDIEEWDGTSNRGINNNGKNLPTGTYFYVLNLNDSNFDVIKGWVYLNR